MALIGAYDDDRRRDSDCRMDRGYQRYLKWLETQERAIPDPFEIRERAELVDGPVAAPPPPKPRKHRKRKPARRADMPARDSDSINLAKYARKLRGEP
jgi:hypothetical protein